ncbi:MAG: hypothetical protein MSB12_00150 [Lentisphaeraceae bacterium]|nr:hypothetical protein [Lentisphaeraceae bacterium]
MKRVLALGAGLWAAASLWAGMSYEAQAVTFSEKSGSGVTPATITMSGGWALASLTNQAGEAIGFRPLSVSSANGTTFTPDQNIKSSEGPWVATFRPPAGAVLDFISLPIMLYSGATGATSGGAQGNSASTTLTVTLKLNGEETGQSRTLPVTGNGAFTAVATVRFDFAPRAVETVEVRIVQNADTGMNAGLTGLGAGLYAVADEAIAFSGKTAIGATLTEGWSLAAQSCDFKTTASGNNPIATNLTILTPDANVGEGTDWSLTFAAPTLEPVREVGFDVVMFNSSGIAQTSGTTRTVQFTVEALDADGTTVLDTVASAADLLLTSSGTTATAENGSIRLAFTSPVTASRFKITAQRGTNTQENAQLGCYYGLSALRVLRQVTVVTGEAPAADTRATVWVNPTAWATRAVRVGAIYLGEQALPRVTAEAATVTAEVARIAVESFTVQADPGVTGQVIEAGSYAGTAEVEVSLEGAVDPTALRPGETTQGVTVSTDVRFALRVGEVAFQTDPGVAVAYAGAGAQVDLAEAVWWHSASAGSAATQGALPSGVEAQLWVEAGGVLRLAEGAQDWAFAPQTQSGAIEVSAGRVATFAQVIDPGVCAPMVPEGVAVRLGGRLEMEGFVPELVLLGSAAEVASPGVLEVGGVQVAAEEAQLTVCSGGVSVTNPAAEATYCVAGGGLALLAQEPVEVAAVAVRGAGALTLGTEVSVRAAEVAAESSVTAAPETLAQVGEWSGAGKVLVAAEAPGEADFAVAEGAALSVAMVAEVARGWWVEPSGGRVNFGPIGAGAEGSGAATGVVEALRQKVLASALPIPEGTRQFAYCAVGTDGQPRAASEAEALNAAYVFDLQPSAVGAPDGTGTATVEVVYDFGISAMTYAQVAGTAYVLVTAEVRNAPAGEANGADFAAGTAVELRQVAEDGRMVGVEGAEAVASDWQPFGEGEAASGPVRYFRVPLEHFPRGSTALRVVAERQ